MRSGQERESVDKVMLLLLHCLRAVVSPTPSRTLAHANALAPAVAVCWNGGHRGEQARLDVIPCTPQERPQLLRLERGVGQRETTSDSNGIARFILYLGTGSTGLSRSLVFHSSKISLN